jgi:NAD(P)-dependent dehydrogenase (short-subunit alcohol dehydrogenase family)
MKSNTILITGCSSGIGRATAEYFKTKGWHVVAGFKNLAAETEWQANESLLLVQLDVTKPNEIAQAFADAVQKFEKIDVVVNNAGYGLMGPLELATREQIQHQFDVNVFGLIDVTKEAVAHFRSVGGGQIINISSMMGLISLPYFSLYSATKWTVEGLSENLRYELAPLNISVKVVEPGTVKTRFMKDWVMGSRTHVDIYDTKYKKIFAGIEQKMDSGAAPEYIAKIVFTAATDGRATFRYIGDPQAVFLTTVKKLMPLNLFQKIISMNVK